MKLRNVAIIAHVDHGKTTLVDRLLQQSGTFRDNERVAERAMDSNDLERERGITILSKATSVLWKDIRINIVDTPGHADFGGEVERILNMVDGALALVATDEQLDFPILYGSAKEGWMAAKPEGPKDRGMTPLFDLVTRHVAPPTVEEGPLRLLATILEADPYLGRILTGRISSGSIKQSQNVKVLSREGKLVEQGRVTKLLAFRGLERTAIEEASAGDIVAIAGLESANVSDTIAAPEVEAPIAAQPIDPPTLAMTFRVNDSPIAGTEGDKVTSRMIRDRLFREAEGNVGLRIGESSEKDAYEVAGRGELQLAILIETMRREGFEISVSRPKVVLSRDEKTGEFLEPIEEVVVDVDEEHSGIIVQKLSERRGEMMEMRPSGGGRLRLVFHVPTRGLLGYQSELLTDTRGTAGMNRLFNASAPFKGEIPGRRNGVLISTDQGSGRLCAVEPRGPRADDHRAGLE